MISHMPRDRRGIKVKAFGIAVEGTTGAWLAWHALEWIHAWIQAML